MNTNWKKQITENYEEISKYNYLGIRGTCQDEDYKIGDYARNSYDWDAENDCSSNDQLEGTSTIQIDNTWLEGIDDLINRIENSITDVDCYHGQQIVVLGGNYCSQGTDEGEIIIRGAKVLAIIK